jgi:hypothetical protein
MIFLKAFLDIYFTVCLHGLLLFAMIVSFGVSLDPYAPPEQNLAFLMLALIPMWFWTWQYLTRNEEIKVWQIF